MEFPKSRKVIATTISREELDRQLLQVAKDHGYDNYHDYCVYVLHKPNPLGELYYKNYSSSNEQTT